MSSDVQDELKKRFFPQDREAFQKVYGGDVRPKGKKLTRQEMIDNRGLFINGVLMGRATYEAYRRLGYFEGPEWEEMIFEGLSISGE